VRKENPGRATALRIETRDDVAAAGATAWAREANDLATSRDEANILRTANGFEAGLQGSKCKVGCN